jgi:hypothetical protein
MTDLMNDIEVVNGQETIERPWFTRWLWFFIGGVG